MSKPQINLIWAQNAEDYIGKDGGIPWKHSGDMARFKELTMGHTVIMGRKTWESLPEKFRPLPGRKNIVITRNVNVQAMNNLQSGAAFAASLDEALKNVPEGQIAWIIGGREIYELAMPLANRIYVTAVDDFTIGDVKAPSERYFTAFDCIESGSFPAASNYDSKANFWEVWQRRT